MKKIFIALYALAAMALFVHAREITVSIGAGDGWKIGHEPQLAVWLEDEQGRYLKTLYVTQKASGLSWIFGPKEGRPESEDCGQGQAHQCTMEKHHISILFNKLQKYKYFLISKMFFCVIILPQQQRLF